MCNNYTNINNHLSPSLTEYRKKKSRDRALDIQVLAYEKKA